ncbi:MAG: ATP-binding protein [Bryobacteraceae bacterium]|nr:ATP-binding protein [Bryobacteraceae bacterium]MDW8380386.1 ATP-binding protein [Bryobacterales bacterium]
MSDLRRRVEELEAQLAQQQRLLAIGSLAGGVAHDFNNLLTAILGYASLLKEDPATPPHVLEAVDVIEKAAERASQLTGQLLGFARKGEPKRVRVDLHQVLLEVVELLRHTIDKSIRIETVFDASDAWVMGDPGQLFQVFLNLALNARDAMPEGGILTLQTALMDSRVQASVIDTGVGIPKAIRDRIFEPFFTTKGAQQGTGMGLTVVQRIVKSHGGQLEFDCDHPPGTRFHIFLPLAHPADSAPRAGESKPASRGKGAVLVIDDEEVVRQVAARMLKGLGYHAICLENPSEAVEYFRRRRQDIDAIILDLVMPGLGGKACFEALREIDPQARVILTSGYSLDSSVETLIGQGAKAFLQKPYRVQQLSEILSKVLAP